MANQEALGATELDMRLFEYLWPCRLIFRLAFASFSILKSQKPYREEGFGVPLFKGNSGGGRACDGRMLRRGADHVWGAGRRSLAAAR